MFPSELSAGDVEGLRKLYASEIAKRNGTPLQLRITV
jgi:hypothetical protein